MRTKELINIIFLITFNGSNFLNIYKKLECFLHKQVFRDVFFVLRHKKALYYKIKILKLLY